MTFLKRLLAETYYGTKWAKKYLYCECQEYCGANWNSLCKTKHLKAWREAVEMFKRIHPELFKEKEKNENLQSND